MKIALLWPDYWPYIRRGAERMVHDIAEYLASQGHTVHILASKPGSGSVEQRGPITIFRMGQVDHPLLRFYSYRLKRLTYRFDLHAFQVVPHLLRERYDLVHVFSHIYAVTLPLTRALRRTPTIFHVVMIPPTWPRRFDRQLVELSLRSCDAVRVFSDFCRDYMAQHYGIDSFVLPPTVDTEAFRPVHQRDQERPKILFTADLVQPQKGAYLLAMAFNEVHRACPEAVLQLAGPVGFNPPAVKHLLHLVEPEARGAVEMLGPGQLQMLPRLYSEASVSVLPSLEEPFGMVLTESLACGTPVVGARSGTLPEIISDPAVGTLFERTDDAVASAHDLAGALLRTLELARDPATVERCRRHVQAWTWAAVGDDLNQLQDLAMHRNHQVRIPA